MGELYAYRLKVELPLLKKGSVFYFDSLIGEVYASDGEGADNTALRRGLAGYLWLLKGEGKKYLVPTKRQAVVRQWEWSSAR